MHTSFVEVEVAYNQFYLMDAATEPEVPAEWSDEDVLRRVKVAPSLVVLCPAKDFGAITVAIELVDHAPDLSVKALEAWQHAILCSIDLPSGGCAVEECEGALHHVVSAQPGTCRVLFLCAGMDTLTEDGFEGNDTYRILLWPAPPCRIHVLKQWQGRLTP